MADHVSMTTRLRVDSVYLPSSYWPLPCPCPSNNLLFCFPSLHPPPQLSFLHPSGSTPTPQHSTYMLLLYRLLSECCYIVRIMCCTDDRLSSFSTYSKGCHLWIWRLCQFLLPVKNNLYFRQVLMKSVCVCESVCVCVCVC